MFIFLCLLYSINSELITHTIIEPPPFFNCRFQVHIFHLLFNPSYILSSLWRKISNFDFFLCSMVHFLCSLANSSCFSVSLSYIRFPSSYLTKKAFFHKCSSDGWARSEPNSWQNLVLFHKDVIFRYLQSLLDNFVGLLLFFLSLISPVSIFFFS